MNFLRKHLEFSICALIFWAVACSESSSPDMAESEAQTLGDVFTLEVLVQDRAQTDSAEWIDIEDALLFEIADYVPDDSPIEIDFGFRQRVRIESEMAGQSLAGVLSGLTSLVQGDDLVILEIRMPVLAHLADLPAETVFTSKDCSVCSSWACVRSCWCGSGCQSCPCCSCPQAP